MNPALYVHVPFCKSKCAYCDFASYPGREDVWDAYFGALMGELRAWTDAIGNSFSTAFIGGGTPSLVPERYIVRVAEAISAGEFTIECNPGTVTPDKLRAYRGAGINRLSMGVQAFDDRLLKVIGRVHTAAEAERAFGMARGAGFDNISLDLMYALPGQAMEDWERTLARAAALSPEHLSAYSLILEETTPIAGWAQPMGEDETLAMQRRATRFLAGAGYARYEISNYARAGRECAHNIAYWTRGEYIGVGCAAHSLHGGARFANPASIEEYLKGVRRIDETILARRDEIEETVLLGTRMTRGIGEADLPDRRAAERLAELGLAEFRGGRFRLTERGLEVQNAAVAALLEHT